MRRKKEVDFFSILKKENVLLTILGILFAVTFFILIFNYNNNNSSIRKSPLDITSIDPDNLPTYDNVEPNKLIKEILNKSQLGRFFLQIDSILEALNPLFELFIGINYSLSIEFLIAVMIWISIVIIIWKGITVPLQIKQWIAFLIGAIITTIGAQSGIIRTSAKFIAPLIKEPFVIIWVLLIVLFGNIVYSKVMKRFGQKLRDKWKKEEEERQLQKNRIVEKINDIRLISSGIRP